MRSFRMSMVRGDGYLAAEGFGDRFMSRRSGNSSTLRRGRCKSGLCATRGSR
jgi:hypothetical protein